MKCLEELVIVIKEDKKEYELDELMKECENYGTKNLRRSTRMD
jgi:hypothetical protein